MRRSLRRISKSEVAVYTEAEQLFTAQSLDEAKERLTGTGRDLAEHCFFSWVRDGVRYFRVWEDKRLKNSVAAPAAFGTISATLKRAEAEKLYIKAKRYKGSLVKFAPEAGALEIADAETGEIKAHICLPQIGGELVFEPSGWTERQAALFVNVLLVRDHSVDTAFTEAEALQP
jgi:hypothetical protein